MTTFREQHPKDLLSRMYILEIMRTIGADALYEKANKEQKKQMFYKFTDEVTNTSEVDLNWEYCLFNTTMLELDNFMQKFVDEAEQISAQMIATHKKKMQANQKQPTSISVYDMAKADMKENQDITKLKIVK